MKKQTATVSELIEKLTMMKKEFGDVKVYVVQANEEAMEVNSVVTFNGVSASAAALQIASSDEKGVLLFHSDEVLKP